MAHHWPICALVCFLLLAITIRPNESATTTITSNVTTPIITEPPTNITTAGPANSTTSQTISGHNTTTALVNVTTAVTLVNVTTAAAAPMNATTSAPVNGTNNTAQSTAGPPTNTIAGNVTASIMTFDLAARGAVFTFEDVRLSTANGTVVFSNVTVSTAGYVVIGHVIISQQADTTTTTTAATTPAPPAPACTTTSETISLVMATGGVREDTTCSGILGVICLLFGVTVIVFVVRFRQPLCHRQDCFRTAVNEDAPPSCVCGQCVCGLYRPDEGDKTKMSRLANEDEIGGGGDGGIPMKLLHSHGPRRSLAEDKAPLETRQYDNRGFSGDGEHRQAAGSGSDGHHHLHHHSHAHHQGQPAAARKTSRDDAAEHSNGSGPRHPEGSKSYQL